MSTKDLVERTAETTEQLDYIEKKNEQPASNEKIPIKLSGKRNLIDFDTATAEPESQHGQRLHNAIFEKLGTKNYEIDNITYKDEPLKEVKMVRNSDNGDVHVIRDSGKFLKPKNKKGDIYVIEHKGKKK